MTERPDGPNRPERPNRPKMGNIRVCLKDREKKISGIVREYRVIALLSAVEGNPLTIGDLIFYAQKFFCGNPFYSEKYEGLFGSLKKMRIDAEYTEKNADGGIAIFDLPRRKILLKIKGKGWRRRGWLYYHDGEGFTRKKVNFEIPDEWIVEGSPEDTSEQIEWNEKGREPFSFEE